MTTNAFILIRQLPSGEIAAHGTPFVTFEHAAAAAARFLTENKLAGSAAARLYANALARRPLAAVHPHTSGYAFRILRADFTTDNVAITPGLRVITNDVRWATVEATQFMCETDAFGPGGIYHDGWYNLTGEDGHPYNKFNGERLATKSPF